MNTKHTPGPWREGKVNSVVADVPVLGMRGSDDVDYYGGHMVAESVAPANAEFIVRACNAHDELVAALQLMLTTYGSLAFAAGIGARICVEDWEDADSALHSGRAALAKARK